MSTQPPRILYLVQSGATAWQAAERIQGATDLPASEQGLAAIREALGVFEGDRPIGLVAAGPDEASRQTAALIRAEVCPGAKIKKIKSLEEINLGLWQGMTRTAFAERHPKVYGRWKSDPWRVSPPEGEMLDEAAERCRAALGKVIGKQDAGSAIVVVLRPIMLALAKAAVTDTDVTPWLGRADVPVVERFELDPETARALRSTRRHKRISA